MKTLTQHLPFSGLLIDQDYVLLEGFNQTCWQTGSCFHFAAAGCVCVHERMCTCMYASVCVRCLMMPELILQLFLMDF